jgi:hypothetical protein
MKRLYLVLYDYGQRGVWAYVLAASKAEITEKFPELSIVDEAPSWMSDEFRAALEQRVKRIDDPAPAGLLTDILAHCRQ